MNNFNIFLANMFKDKKDIMRDWNIDEIEMNYT